MKLSEDIWSFITAFGKWAKQPSEEDVDRWGTLAFQLEAENERLRATLGQYADKNNWAHYDKGDGNYVDACFLGPDPAEEALGGE